MDTEDAVYEINVLTAYISGKLQLLGDLDTALCTECCYKLIFGGNRFNRAPQSNQYMYTIYFYVVVVVCFIESSTNKKYKVQRVPVYRIGTSVGSALVFLDSRSTYSQGRLGVSH